MFRGLGSPGGQSKVPEPGTERELLQAGIYVLHFPVTAYGLKQVLSTKVHVSPCR